MVRQTSKVIVLEILAGLGVLGIVVLAALAFRLSAGPIKLGLLKDDLERTLENNRNGRQVTMEDISLEWLSDERRVVITASDLRLYDEADRVAAQARQAEILLDMSGLFVGKVRPVGLVLESGWIGIHQAKTGWSVAGDPVGSETILSETRTIKVEQLLDTANQALVDVLAVLRRDAGELSLETLRFEGVDIVFTQSGLGERARLTQTLGGFTRNSDGIEFFFSGQSTGTDGAPGKLLATLEAPGDYQTIKADMSLEGWSLQSVADTFPAFVGSVQGMPSNLILGLQASAETGLDQISFSADAGAGEILYGGTRYTIRNVGLQGTYLPGRDELTFDLKDFNSRRVRGDLSSSVSNVLKARDQRRIDLESPRLLFDLPDHFEEKVLLENLSAGGVLSLPGQRLTLESLSFALGDARLKAQGEASLLETTEPGQLPFKLELTAEMTGALSSEELIGYWPIRLTPGTRAFISRTVKAARLTGAKVQLDLAPDSLVNKGLIDEALLMNFDLADVTLQALSDIPPVTGINATGRMTGDTLAFSFVGGKLRNWEIEKGEVDFSQLRPGGNMTLSLNGAGPVQSLVQMVSDSRLQLQAKTGFDPTKLSGMADLDFTMTRPTKPNVPAEEYIYTARARVRSGGLSEAYNALSVTDSAASVLLTENGIKVKGVGALDKAPLEYDWSLAFGTPGTAAVLKAKSLLTPDLLNSFGLVGRAYLTGGAPVEFEALLDGSKLRSIDAAFDLSGVRLEVAELNWVKPVGKTASADLRYVYETDAPRTMLFFNAEDAAFNGTFTLEDSGRLLSANVEQAYLEDRIDLSGTARRTDRGTLEFAVEGTFLDLSELVPGLSTFEGKASNSENTEGGFGDILLKADIERVRLRQGFEAKETRLEMVSGTDGVQTLEARGLLPNGAVISGAFDASGLGDPTFLVNSGDASFLASVFLGIDALKAGSLQMSGTLASGNLPTQVRLVIENGRLKQAPFVTQILSMASLRGITDTLSGEGVLFTSIELPLTISKGRYDIVGARAFGPALGLTARGQFIPSSGEIDINGVLVPSFGMNSALGGLPIIGDLFVSRQGEGVISLRYDIEGTLQQAQVSVNPLSAITPGVLRRIFEDPAEAELLPLDQKPGPKPDE